MSYSLCDMWGCLPIIVSTTTTTTPTTANEETLSNISSTEINYANRQEEKSDIAEIYLIPVVATLTFIIVLAVIISTVWCRRIQKKKRSEKTKSIQVLILMAQRSALTDTTTTRGERSAVNDHPDIMTGSIN